MIPFIFSSTYLATMTVHLTIIRSQTILRRIKEANFVILMTWAVLGGLG